MKNSSIKKILAAVLLIFFNNIFASDLTCPPREKIREMNLIQANNLARNLWLLNSEAFNHEGSEWNIWIETELLNANTSEEALKEGQKYFHELALIIDPSPIGTDNAIICMYHEHDPVFAISPPLYQPSDRLVSFMKK